MLVIHHKDVRMTHPVAAGDSSLCVNVTDRQVPVLVLDHLRVLRRPDPRRHQHSQGTSSTQDRKAHRHAEARAKPAGQGIKQQPACMRERELSGEKRWPVLGVGGAPQQAP